MSLNAGSSSSGHRSSRLVLRLAMAAALALTGCARAWSQQSGGSKAVRQACTADYQALCTGTRPGGGRIAACFKENADKLSQGCRDALAGAKSAQP
jgi:hypothetical protein